MKHDVAAVVRHFPIEGTFQGAEPYGSGHINDTYLSTWNVGGKIVRSLQQRINHNVFREPPKVMDNIVRVTKHLHEKLASVPGANPAREALTVIPTRTGAPYYRDSDGNHWRTYVFIEGARTYDVCEGPQQAHAAAKAIGRFQQLLSDLPADSLHETIPFFHHTPRRFQALEAAIEADAVGRVARTQKEIEFALARKSMTGTVIDLMESGAMPRRITHNDTKLNNVMIDDVSGEGICVIDLDTVMSGSALYDFGDMVRSSTLNTREDEPDAGKVAFRMDIFEALVRGYLQHAAEFLTPVELQYLAFAGRLITFTIGIRFLTDYLMGDVYFKIHSPEHNLFRTRVQFKMIRDMEEREKEMEAIVRRHVSKKTPSQR